MVALASIIISHQLNQPLIFFALLAFIAIILSIILSFWLKDRVIYNLEYVASAALVASTMGVLLGYFVTPIVFLGLGAIVTSATVKGIFNRYQKVVYLEDFYIIIVSFVGFWVIYYKFVDLGNVGILLAVNTALLIGILSHALMKVKSGERGEEPVPVKSKESVKLNFKIKPNVDFQLKIKYKDVREFSQYTTLFLAITYIVILFLRNRVEILGNVNLTHLAMITTAFAMVSLAFYFKERL